MVMRLPGSFAAIISEQSEWHAASNPAAVASSATKSMSLFLPSEALVYPTTLVVAADSRVVVADTVSSFAQNLQQHDSKRRGA